MDYKINHICVPVSFSETALNVLDVALRIAYANQAKVHILHVVNCLDPNRFADVQKKISAKLELIVSSAITNFQEAEVKGKTISIPISIEIKNGRMGRIIQKFEKDCSIDLTIVGTHGIMSLKEMIAGTTAMKILKNTSCPALTIPREFKKNTIESVLYPIRDTDTYATRFGYLFPLIMQSKIRIHLLAIFTAAKIEDNELFENKLKEFKESIDANTIEFSFEMLVSKSISKTIVNTAEKLDADLIALYSRTDRKWYRIFRSYSFTNKMINDSKKPILCIKSNNRILNF